MVSKYKIGDQLIVMGNVEGEKQELKDIINLDIQENYTAKLTWAIHIQDVEYEPPYVTLTYTNVFGKKNKVFAECSNIEKFNRDEVLEKAVLKAFQMEIMDVSVVKSKGRGWTSPYQ